jgi:RNA polymerase sigma factor (TIGR02999 family)
MPEITRVLERLNRGEERAFDELVPLVYEELRRRATRRLRPGADHATMEPTALVHEAFIRLMSANPSNWKGSRHFYNAAAQIMRQVLLNHARGKGAQKRGGGRKRVALNDLAGDDAAVVAMGDDVDQAALDAAMNELREMDERRYQVVMLRYFAALTDAQVAAALGVSEKTVERDWATARAFLKAKMSQAQVER